MTIRRAGKLGGRAFYRNEKGERVCMECSKEVKGDRDAFLSHKCVTKTPPKSQEVKPEEGEMTDV